MGKVIMGDIKQTLVDIAQKAWDANIKEDAEFYRNFLIDEAVGVNNFGIVGKLPGIQHGKSKKKPMLCNVALLNFLKCRLITFSHERHNST